MLSLVQEPTFNGRKHVSYTLGYKTIKTLRNILCRTDIILCSEILDTRIRQGHEVCFVYDWQTTSIARADLKKGGVALIAAKMKR